MLGVMKRVALLSLFFLLPVVAASPEPPEELRVTEVIVFKNGLAFVTREGALSFRGGEALVVPAPDALLGTLWVGAGDRRIDGVRASKEMVQVESEASSIAALLDANAGKKVSLLVDDREYTGTLVEAPATLVLLRIEGKTHAFERASVKSVAFADAPSLKASQAESRAVLSIQAKGGDGSEEATLRYLRSGVSWIPAYTIELLDGERARVAMKATLINDGEELRGARIRFAVGYPNFAFAGVPSPMTLQQTLQEFLTTLAGSTFGGNDRFANVMTQQLTVNYATAGSADRALPGPPAMGESAEDLFFYEKEAVTLAKGERGSYPILTEVVPFAHLYRWTVGAEENEKPDQVWHSISVANRGTTPWTTAPALVVSNGKPLAQDTLPYTASGSRAEVKLTLATDVAVEHAEVEVERKPRDLQRSGIVYDAVTVEGTLTMRNFKREAITLDVTKDIEGQSTLRDAGGQATRLALRPKAVNPSERLEWQVPLPAGATRTVKYRYKVWVRE
jgi:hypothetical protein